MVNKEFEKEFVEALEESKAARRKPRFDKYETLVMRICDACKEKLANWEKFNSYEAELIRVEIRHLLSIAETGLKNERGNKNNG